MCKNNTFHGHYKDNLFWSRIVYFMNQLHMLSDVSEKKCIPKNIYTFVTKPNESIKIFQKFKRLLSYNKSYAHSFWSEKYYPMFSETQICNIVIVVFVFFVFGLGISFIQKVSILQNTLVTLRLHNAHCYFLRVIDILHNFFR